MPTSPLCISGVHPHLTVYNKPETIGDTVHPEGGGEVGIGAVVPWAGKLWLITYPQHDTRGGSDKLWTVDADLTQEMRPESVGGTHACRMIHRESDQLIIGPYFISADGAVRAADVNQLVGRMTAVCRHLTDPADRVYFIDMEGAIYEVDVHTLAVTRLFRKPVPGWHAKGGYTAQGRLIMSNNGERHGYDYGDELRVGGPPAGEEAGVLAEWDGNEWRIVERKQFLDITGPGGLLGAPDDDAPAWAIGWDRRSVILKLLDNGVWSTFRLPKATHTYDPRHGWYTEWPRIREAAPGRWLMDMHGMFYEFLPTFRAGNTAGIRPLASHLRYIPDFCHWNGRVVLAADDASMMENPMVGQPQSNLWFGDYDELRHFGPRSGWGGPWVDDDVRVDVPSDPFLVAGFERRVLHLHHTADTAVTFTLQVDSDGTGDWATRRSVTVAPRGTAVEILGDGFEGIWLRLVADTDCRATAYLHQASDRPDDTAAGRRLAAGLADAGAESAPRAGLIRPAAHNTSLQFVPCRIAEDGTISDAAYYEIDGPIRFSRPEQERIAEVLDVARPTLDFRVDDASVIMTWKGQPYRLPKTDPAYDTAFAFGWPRGVREVQSERNLANIHGTFYEIPRDDGIPMIKPVCTHGKQVMDYCSWRGLLVLSGVAADAQPDGHVFVAEDGQAALWFGAVDDLWRFGKPVGTGGPLRSSQIEAGCPSDPYLMTGYDRKQVELSHNAPSTVTFSLDIDVAHRGWVAYAEFAVSPGTTVTHAFPGAFSAHWVRVTVSQSCQATAWFVYS